MKFFKYRIIEIQESSSTSNNVSVIANRNPDKDEKVVYFMIEWKFLFFWWTTYENDYGNTFSTIESAQLLIDYWTKPKKKTVTIHKYP